MPLRHAVFLLLLAAAAARAAGGGGGAAAVLWTHNTTGDGYYTAAFAGPGAVAVGTFGEGDCRTDVLDVGRGGVAGTLAGAQ
jgi:hypothetical protein